MSTARSALTAYRNALRATRIAFTDDLVVLQTSRQKIKDEMKLNNSPSNPLLKVEERIELLNQISEFLKHNIVQGVKTGKLDDGKDKYTLNIHKETELGDNDEIKTKSDLNVDGSPMQGACCGGGKVEMNQKK